MPSRTPESRELRIIHVGAISRTSKGNCYLECNTGDGTVAFWGKTGNMSNITTIQQHSPPFRVQCGCIPSNWTKHDLWVPQSSPVSVLADPAETQLRESPAVSID